MMKLSFSNPSRSFDESHSRVCFWGYDRTIEIAFFVELDALKHLCPNMDNVESAYLRAFDDALTQIHVIADKAYKHDGSGSYSYILTVKDF